MPFAGLQLTVRQAGGAAHCTSGGLLQKPFWHVSVPLQALPSPQPVPLATGGKAQPLPGLQLSCVQGLPSLQFGAPPRLQLPFWHVSAPLQALPSVQLVPLATLLRPQPACAVQVSLVHGLPSLQLSAAQLNTQLPPPWHTCPAGQLRAALISPLSQVWNCVPFAHWPPLQLLQRLS